MLRILFVLGVLLVAHVPPPYPQTYPHGHGFSSPPPHGHFAGHSHTISLTDHIKILISDKARASLNPPDSGGEKISQGDFIAIPIDTTTLNFGATSTLTGWDVTSLTLTTSVDSKIVPALNYTSPSHYDMWIRPDGKEIFVLMDEASGFDLHQVVGYTLSTPFDLDTLSYDGNTFDLRHTQDTDPDDIGMNAIRAFAFSPDGLHMYIAGSVAFNPTPYGVRQWALSLPFDLTTAIQIDTLLVDPFSANGNVNNFPASITFGRGVDAFGAAKEEGTRLFLSTTRAWDGSVDNNDGTIVFDLSSPWNIGTATMNSSWLKNTTLGELDIRPDGGRLFLGRGGGVITQYDVTADNEWDISTATANGTSVDLTPTPMNGLNALRFSSDGTKLFTMDSQGIIYCFDVEGQSKIKSTVNNLPVYKSGGNIRKKFTTITGLEDFEGECLSLSGMGVVANGDVVNSLCATTNPNCVTAGSITLCNSASRVQIGWRYISDVETLDIESQQGTMQGKIKRVPSVTIRFKKSRLGLVGPDKFHLTKIKQRDQEAMGTPTTLLTGDKKVKLEPVWNSNGRIFYRQLDPLPFTILAIIPDLNLEDGPDD